MPRLLTFVGFLSFVVMVTWALVRWLTAKARREYAASAAQLRQIRAMPVEEAASHITAGLEAGEMLRCVGSAVSPSSLPEVLPPLLRDFFSRYQRVETTSGQLTAVDRTLIRASETRPGFFAIGRGMEATDVEYEIAIRPGREEILAFYPGEEPDPTFGRQPTIFHFLLAVVLEVEEARSRTART
jgi:hypothetical protein